MQLVMRRAPCTHAAPQADPTVGKKEQVQTKKRANHLQGKQIEFSIQKLSNLLSYDVGQVYLQGDFLVFSIHRVEERLSYA